MQVLQLSRSIQGNPDKHVVFLQKWNQPIGQRIPVALQRVSHRFMGTVFLLDKGKELAEETSARKGGFPPLEGKAHPVACLKELGDGLPCRLLAHDAHGAGLPVGYLVKVEAVRAMQVAGRGSGFDHHGTVHGNHHTETTRLWQTP